MAKIVTRFPPSPTGYLHIGGARTALFNWLFARAGGGTFVLRIEDTDTARSTPEMTKAIVDGMQWLGLDWDDGPYRQSDRTALYNEYIERLIAAGRAYYCDCSPLAVDAMRDKARAEGKKPCYDGTCREKNLGPGKNRVVRFMAPQGICAWDDLVKGHMHVDFTEMVDDFIIRRSNGSPMYNLAVVVDDMDMEISHIIRGEDHLSNTPKQIALYRALGSSVPVFGHVPMIFGPDKKKLSKRHGAMSVMEYEKTGFLPQAMRNYLVRLGWGYGDQEIFSTEELLQIFSPKGMSSSPSVFDMAKLTSINEHYIKHTPANELAPLLARYLKELGHTAPPEYMEETVRLYQPRSSTMADMARQCAFFFVPDDALTYDEKAVKKHIKSGSLDILKAIRQDLALEKDFSQKTLEKTLKDCALQKDIKFPRLAQPLRIAVTGSTMSPAMDETLATLGKEKVLARLDRFLALQKGAA